MAIKQRQHTCILQKKEKMIYDNKLLLVTLYLLFTQKGKKVFHTNYIQEMSDALVLHWLNEKYP